MKIVAHLVPIVAATALACESAYAEEFYLGISRTTPGEAYADFASATVGMAALASARIK